MILGTIFEGAILTPFAVIFAGALIAWQVRRHMAFGLVALQLFLVVVGALGFYKIETQQDDTDKIARSTAATQQHLNKERKARSKVQAEINRYVCVENNKQDRVLASLIVASTGDGAGAFGEGIDPDDLTPFDVEVLKSIAKVQALSEASGGADFREAFERALRQLRRETPCSALVAAFTEASDTQDFKAIRRILRAQDDLKEPSPKPKKESR